MKDAIISDRSLDLPLCVAVVSLIFFGSVFREDMIAHGFLPIPFGLFVRLELMGLSPYSGLTTGLLIPGSGRMIPGRILRTAALEVHTALPGLCPRISSLFSSRTKMKFPSLAVPSSPTPITSNEHGPGTTLSNHNAAQTNTQQQNTQQQEFPLRRAMSMPSLTAAWQKSLYPQHHPMRGQHYSPLALYKDREFALITKPISEKKSISTLITSSSSSNDSSDPAREKCISDAKKFVGAFIPGSIGASLFLEGYLVANKKDWMVGQTLLGYMQRSIALVGTSYYTYRFFEDDKKDPNEQIKDALMIFGNLLFAAEGATRPWEAQKKHLPRTNVVGAAAALTKLLGARTPFCAFAYFFDLLTNTVEFGHSIKKPKEKGILQAMYGLGHNVTNTQIKNLLYLAGVAQLTNGGLKFKKLVTDNAEFQQPAPAAISEPADIKPKTILTDRRLFEKFDNIESKLKASREVQSHFMQLAEAGSDEQFAKDFMNFWVVYGNDR